MSKIEQAYKLARQQYAEVGVNTDDVLKQAARIPISVQCWQGDDVSGFENPDGALTGGIAVTGNYPGKARTPDQLRADLDQAMALIPGKHRLNLHASYADSNSQGVERNELQPEHFQGWIDWAKGKGIGLDFNPTYFSHPKSADGFTLSHQDRGIRQFWIEHGICCRHIAAAMGKALENPCITNFWIPDGYKDTPIDRKGPRERLADSLDSIFADSIDPKLNQDAVECKLFGIGSESYVVGSHEFYLGYAVRNNKILCLDAGHFHPTESISDKISSILQWVGELLLHVSRGVRWDSDHVVTFTDELQAIMQEIVRGEFIDRVHIGLDFFDASINRVAAWVIGTRATSRALLQALLEPTELLRKLEADGDLTARLAMLEEIKNLPASAVWDYFCQTSEVPVGRAWLDEVQTYEKQVLSKR
ncbi:L-rhamnose isomerase [Bythopirellula polymerisocia]|uniref:L-rhamnose isomerase n=1 Tax=Bythopirellula polymerisocia TaxID=2528003 RepID=A0A5C6D4W1_9BACT|nr:L-rhamnose isomerase [Bythopirellula polymerisocia]TWU30246.1 L-rhamnose isomerase [Bythopirellula polymerisocia]